MDSAPQLAALKLLEVSYFDGFLYKRFSALFKTSPFVTVSDLPRRQSMSICHRIKNNLDSLAQGNDNEGGHVVVKQLNLFSFVFTL